MEVFWTDWAAPINCSGRLASTTVEVETNLLRIGNGLTCTFALLDLLLLDLLLLDLGLTTSTRLIRTSYEECVAHLSGGGPD